MSNLFTIFSPQGERFEVTKPNFTDLTTHAGWSASDPTAIAAGTVPPVADFKDDENAEDEIQSESEQPVPTEDGEAGDEDPEFEGEGEGQVEETTLRLTVEETTLRLTVEEFADLEEKADVAAYIASNFPDYKIDGRANRDKLIAAAIELANDE